MYKEEDLIARAMRAIPSVKGAQPALRRRQTGVELGIGDDAAVFSRSSGRSMVVSCDAFLEGIHFWKDVHPADAVGYKALARAVNDLAAMGAQPTAFFLTLGLPSELTGKWLDGFFRGMGRAAQQLGIRLAGGDTSRFSTVTVSLTVLGEVRTGCFVKRAGARAGDAIYVSGHLGCAQLGLEVIRELARRGGKRGKDMKKIPAGLTDVLQTHLYPQIHLALGAWLARNQVASTMMDLSDGLSMDLPRLCRASGVGARIYADRIPKVAVPSTVTKRLGAHGAKLDPLQMALHGGDDYELLFTVPKRKIAALKRVPGYSHLRAIGEIVANSKRVTIVDGAGNEKPLRVKGWDSFREK